MQLTPTDKKIIEILSPFARKDLTEGCMIKFMHDGHISTYWDDVGKNGQYKILGHIDIHSFIDFTEDSEHLSINLFRKHFQVYDRRNQEWIIFPNTPPLTWSEEVKQKLISLDTEVGTK